MFAHLDRETMEAMAVLTDSAEILDRLDDYENKEGGGMEISMCLAVDEMRRDWKEEGKAEGIIETALELGMPESAILDRLQRKLALPCTAGRQCKTARGEIPALFKMHKREFKSYGK